MLLSMNLQTIICFNKSLEKNVKTGGDLSTTQARSRPTEVPRAQLLRFFPSTRRRHGYAHSRFRPLLVMAADLNPDWLSCLPSSWSYGVTRDGRIFFIK